MNQQSVGSEEATPPRQTTARNPQPAVTPLDSHQAPRWDSETNIPPTDRLFRDAPSQDTSWKRDVGKDEPACDRCRNTKIGDHKHRWPRPHPHTAAPGEDRNQSSARFLWPSFSPLMFGRQSNIVAYFGFWRGLRRTAGPGPGSGCGRLLAAAIFPAVWLFSSLILILPLISRPCTYLNVDTRLRLGTC